MRWVDAVKTWNTQKGGPWVVPRKGTPEHAAVKNIASQHTTGAAIAGAKKSVPNHPEKLDPSGRPPRKGEAKIRTVDLREFITILKPGELSIYK